MFFLFRYPILSRFPAQHLILCPVFSCRTAPCRTASPWAEGCCFCSSSTPACCLLCPWEKVCCSFTCHTSSTGVFLILTWQWCSVTQFSTVKNPPCKCVTDVCAVFFFASVRRRTYIPEKRWLRNRLAVSLLKK